MAIEETIVKATNFIWEVVCGNCKVKIRNNTPFETKEEGVEYQGSQQADNHTDVYWECPICGNRNFLYKK